MDEMKCTPNGNWKDIAKIIKKLKSKSSDQTEIFFVDSAVFDDTDITNNIITSERYEENKKYAFDENEELIANFDHILENDGTLYLIVNLQGGKGAHYIAIKISVNDNLISVEICDSDAEPKVDFVYKNIVGLIKFLLSQ